MPILSADKSFQKRFSEIIEGQEFWIEEELCIRIRNPIDISERGRKNAFNLETGFLVDVDQNEIVEVIR